jgi:hypothetical protein
MKINEIINESWPTLFKAFNMLRKSKKFSHLDDDTVRKMAHEVAKKWDSAPKTVSKKPSTVKDLTTQYKKDKIEMDDADFKKYYGFGKHSAGKVIEGANKITFESFLEDVINEHRMVWKSTKKGPKLAWRCTSGFRANRTVPDARDCGKPLDYAQRARMKVTRARTSKAQARKAKKTKKINPTSKLIRKMNKATAPKKRKR